MDHFEPCVLVVDILKMCIWVFDGTRIYFDRKCPFQLRHLWQFFFFHCRIWSLCNQLLLQFSMDHYETMHPFDRHIEDVHVGF